MNRTARPTFSSVRRAGLVVVVIAASLVAFAGPASAAAPPAPTNLTAVTSPTSKNTTLSWTLSPGASGYEVVCQREGYNDITRTIGLNTNTATVRLAADGWTLCGIRAQTLGEWSAEVLFPSIKINALPAVTGLAIVPYSGELTVTWDRPANVGMLDGWRVHVSPNAVDDQWVFAQDPTPSAVITGLAPAGYNITVTPYRIPDNNGYQFATFGSQFQDVFLGATPDGPTITDLTSNPDGFDISWDPPAETGGSAITGYEVRYWGEWTPNEGTAFTATADKRSLHVPAAVAQNYWNVQIRAKNVNGYGATTVWHATPGSPWNDMVYTYDQPSPVRGLFVRVNNAGDLWIDWATPTHLPTGMPAQPTYEVEVIGAINTYELVTNATELNMNTHVFPNGWYQARVRITKYPLGDDVFAIGTPEWSTRWFAVGDPCDHPFPDVTGPPFCTPISWMVRSGITTGSSDGTFGPTKAVTRQAMAGYLYRAKGSPLGPNPTCTTKPFSDVEITNPFCGQIKWMVDRGIASGYPDGTFQRTAPVSRQAAAAFLYRASSVTPKSGSTSIPPPACVAPNEFSDVPATNAFCGYIEWMKTSGITTGFSDGTYKPTASVNRQAMSAFLYRWHP